MMTFSEGKYCLLCILLAGLTQLSVQDPCNATHHKVLKNEVWRSVNYSLPAGASFKCDNSVWLPSGWYRFDSPSGGDMATFCPSFLSCGTFEPVYLGGSLPSVSQGNVTLNVLANTLSTGCGSLLGTAVVKNCSGYYVYHLFPMNTCSRAYCVGDASECPQGTMSSTGFQPPLCLPLLANVTQTVSMAPWIRTTTSRGFTREEAEFRCTTTFTAPGMSINNLRAEVEWYASKRGLVHSETAPMTSLNHTFYLKSSDNWMNPTENLNQNISCRVRISVSSSIGTQYSKRIESVPFYAGLEISTPIMSVNESTTATVKVRSTMPFSSYYRTGSPILSPVDVLLHVPYYQGLKKWHVCGNKTLLEMQESGCGIRLYSSNWSNWTSFTIHAKKLPTGSAALTKITLATTTTSNISPIFSNTSFPDIIHINIRPASTKSTSKRTCSLLFDPHLTTFDGYKYDHQMAGEYIIVNDTANDIQVNGYFQSTASSWFSLCAIAVRSAGDVFIYDRCKSSSASLKASGASGTPNVQIGTVGCNIGGISFWEDGGSKFEVRLANEMLIKGSHIPQEAHHINLYVKARDRSFGHLYGLCGTFNADPLDDLLRSDFITRDLVDNSNPYSHHVLFSQSWEATNTTGLFGSNSVRSTHYTPIYCTCPKTGSHTTVFHEASCEGGTAQQTCTHNKNLVDLSKVLFKQCTHSGRKRRAVNTGETETSNHHIRDKRSAVALGTDYDTEFEFVPYVGPSTTFPTPRWRNGWNASYAHDLCNSTLSEPRAQTALSVPGMDKAGYIGQCVYDIKTSGADVYVKPLVETVVDEAHDLLIENETLWTTSSSGVFQPDFSILNELCPQNCSNNGACVEGTCSCYGDYIGGDCSRSLHDPPAVSGVAWGGVCDSSVRPCQAIALYGDNFIPQSSTAACYVEEFEVDASGTIVSRFTPQKTSMEVASRYKAYCDLPTTNRGKRSSHRGFTVQGYNVQVTNNGTYLSTNVTVLVADTRCLDCNATTMQCPVKNDTCMIHQQCYFHNETDIKHTCLECNPETNQTSFTLSNNTCFIGGQCYSGNTYNSSCEICDPSNSQESWTDLCLTASSNTTDWRLYLAGAAALLLVIVIVIVIVVVKKKNSPKRKVNADSADDSSASGQPPERPHTASNVQVAFK